MHVQMHPQGLAAGMHTRRICTTTCHDMHAAASHRLLTLLPSWLQLSKDGGIKGLALLDSKLLAAPQTFSGRRFAITPLRQRGPVSASNPAAGRSVTTFLCVTESKVKCCCHILTQPPCSTSSISGTLAAR